MKTLCQATTLAATLASLASLCMGCTSTPEASTKKSTPEFNAGANAETRAATSSNPGESNMQQGWEKVRKGSGQVEDGVQAQVKEGTSRSVQALKEGACPVVADKSSKLYYTKEDRAYAAMLKGEKIFGTDNRECFRNAGNALEAGYAHVGTKAR